MRSSSAELRVIRAEVDSGDGGGLSGAASAGSIVLLFDESPELNRAIETLRPFGRPAHVVPPHHFHLDAAARHDPGLLLVEASAERLGERLGIVKAIRRDERLRCVPLIAAADRGIPALAAAALAAGADEVVPWPAEPAELRARVSTVLSRTESSATLARERTNLQRVLKVYREVTASLDPDGVMRAIVGAVAEITGATRTSIVLVEPARGRGVVVAAAEDPALRDLEIDLSRYPEIAAVMARRCTVVVDDLTTHPIMGPAQSWTAGLAGTSALLAPLVWEEEVLGTLLLRARRPGRRFTQSEIDLCELIAASSVNALRNAIEVRRLREDHARLETLCTLDPLTGLFNHSYLQRRLALECARARDQLHSIGFVMIDVDDFKAINDRHGHVVGDSALRQLAEMIRRTIRRDDVLARYGGEEFALVLPGADLPGAGEQAERLRVAVAEAQLESLPRGERLTISLGVAAAPAEGACNAQELIMDADRALYRAKAAGKNCTCLSL